MVRDLVGYMETRTTQDGRQILHIRPCDKLLGDKVSQKELIRLHPRVLWDLLSLSIRDFKEDGPAPPGTNERAIAKLASSGDKK